MSKKVKGPDLTAGILNDKVPALTDRACKAIEGLLQSNDADLQKAGILGLTKLLPYVVAQQSKVTIEAEGAVDAEAYNDITEFLKARKKDGRK